MADGGDLQRLYTPDDARPWRILVRRALILLIILTATFAAFWFARNHVRLQDGSPGKMFDYIGYVAEILMLGEPKDYTPDSPLDRMIDSTVLSFVKVALLLIVFGTAYEVIAKRFIEWIRMMQLKSNLHSHTLICGFGPEGEAAVRELLAKHVAPDKLLAIEPDVERLQNAAKLGIHGIRGEPSSKDALEDANAGQALAALICTGRDDTNLLTTLAFRALNKSATIIASVTDPNNAHFIDVSGADFVITHATVAGVLMAGGVVSRPVTEALLDLVTADGMMELKERMARDDEVGKRIVEIDDTPALQILRAGKMIGFWEKDGIIQAGDKLVVVEASSSTRPEPFVF